MNPKLETPRLDEPRVAIPAGSVGIAGKQTGIYPVESPGGWRLIGRTPLTLFDPFRDPPVLLEAGMRLRFTSIDGDRFRRIQEGKETWPQ
jgi:KipI family sensor histidine kinase inhibitor